MRDKHVYFIFIVNVMSCATVSRQVTIQTVRIESYWIRQ